jgi:hypothetical protein
LALAALLAGLVLSALLLLAGLVFGALLLTGLILSALLLLTGLGLSALLRIVGVLFVCHRDVLRVGEPPPNEITRNIGGGSSPSGQHLDTAAEIYTTEARLNVIHTGL